VRRLLYYFVKRALLALLSIFVVTVITFLAFFQIPSDPARFLVVNQAPTDQQLEEARAKLGVDDPIYVQYGRFVYHAAHLDFGDSWAGLRGGDRRLGSREDDSVRSELKAAAPVTISLMLGAALLWLAIAVPMGTLAALYPRSILDRGFLLVAVLGVSLHPILIGLLLQQWFGYRWQLTPTVGYCPMGGDERAECASFVDWAHHMALPWASFAFLFIALYSRMIRIAVIETLHENYVRVARARGASEWKVVRSHVLPNSLTPVVTMLGMDLGLMFGSAIFIEQVFRLPGLGNMAARAARGDIGYDLPVLMGVVLTVSTMIVLLNLLVDLAYAYMDPRVRVT
jgi:peptide/nickel transport system permease protein